MWGKKKSQTVFWKRITNLIITLYLIVPIFLSIKYGFINEDIIEELGYSVHHGLMDNRYYILELLSVEYIVLIILNITLLFIFTTLRSKVESNKKSDLFKLKSVWDGILCFTLFVTSNCSYLYTTTWVINICNNSLQIFVLYEQFLILSCIYSTITVLIFYYGLKVIAKNPNNWLNKIINLILFINTNFLIVLFNKMSLIIATLLSVLFSKEFFDSNKTTCSEIEFEIRKWFKLDYFNDDKFITMVIGYGLSIIVLHSILYIYKKKFLFLMCSLINVSIIVILIRMHFMLYYRVDISERFILFMVCFCISSPSLCILYKGLNNILTNDIDWYETPTYFYYFSLFLFCFNLRIAWIIKVKYDNYFDPNFTFLAAYLIFQTILIFVVMLVFSLIYHWINSVLNIEYNKILGKLHFWTTGIGFSINSVAHYTEFILSINEYNQIIYFLYVISNIICMYSNLTFIVLLIHALYKIKTKQ